MAKYFVVNWVPRESCKGQGSHKFLGVAAENNMYRSLRVDQTAHQLDRFKSRDAAGNAHDYLSVLEMLRHGNFFP